jgi:site-specific recombinase XerC
MAELTCADGSFREPRDLRERLLGELGSLLLCRLAPETLRAYEADLRDFAAWCADHGAEALPASGPVVATYLIDLHDRGFSPATILRRRAAIAYAFDLLGDRPNPTQDPIVVQLAHLLREWRPSGPRSSPLDDAVLRLMVRATDSGTRAGARDRALLLLGFAAGLGPRQLVGLDADDAHVIGDQLYFTVASARATSHPFGALVIIEAGNQPGTCPVTAVLSWLIAGAITSGPLFRPIDRHDTVGIVRLSPRAVASIIRRAAKRAGLSPAAYAGSSLRRGAQNRDC